MNTQIKFKVRTMIANSRADEARKNVLESYINTLTERDLVKLIAVFEKEPRAVALYADYVKTLKEESQPVSPEKLEEILTPLLSKLS
ncbi:MAG: hypothetical protein WCG02_03590 [Candidatus Taylorbacteria bacterium]